MLPNGNVQVTFALPNQRTGIAQMPYAEWVRGNAHKLIPALVDIVEFTPPAPGSDEGRTV